MTEDKKYSFGEVYFMSQEGKSFHSLDRQYELFYIQYDGKNHLLRYKQTNAIYKKLFPLNETLLNIDFYEFKPEFDFTTKRFMVDGFVLNELGKYAENEGTDIEKLLGIFICKDVTPDGARRFKITVEEIKVRDTVRVIEDGEIVFK